MAKKRGLADAIATAARNKVTKTYKNDQVQYSCTGKWTSKHTSFEAMLPTSFVQVKGEEGTDLQLLNDRLI